MWPFPSVFRWYGRHRKPGMEDLARNPFRPITRKQAPFRKTIWPIKFGLAFLSYLQPVFPRHACIVIPAIMNLSLHDPFTLAQDSPESLVNDLRKWEVERDVLRNDTKGERGLIIPGSGHATTLRFNRKGDYLASGRVDGKIIIWWVYFTKNHTRFDSGGQFCLIHQLPRAIQTRFMTNHHRDCETWGIAMKLVGHWKQIQSLRYVVLSAANC